MIINRDTKNAFVLGDFESVAATPLRRVADTPFFGLDKVRYASKKRKLVNAYLDMDRKEATILGMMF